MPRDFYESTIGMPDEDDDKFIVLSDVRISVFDRGTTDLVNIYQRETGAAGGPSPEAGATGATNPFITGDSGSVQFWCDAPDRYDIKIEDTVAPSRISTRTLQWNAKATDAIPVGVGIIDDRPAAGIIGRRYWATDVHAEYLDIGASWVRLGAPAGETHWSLRAAAATGWMLANGAAIADTPTNAELRAAIGNTLPDLRGRVPSGVDGGVGRMTANNALGNSSGEEKHVLTTAELAAHTHPPSDTAADRFIETNTAVAPPDDVAKVLVAGPSGSGVFVPAILTGTYLSRQATGTRGSDTAHNNMPPNQVGNWYVKI